MKRLNFFLLIMSLVVLISACQTIASEGLTEAQQTAIAGTVTAVMQQKTGEPTADSTELAPTATNDAEKTATPTQKIEYTVVGPDTYPEGVNPLTGLKVDDPELLKRRPVIMKISNHQIDYQPHWGLSSADIIFEYFIGWGANRFAALFYGQDAEKIGPIRSIRRVDGHLGSLYEAVVGSTGGDPIDVLPYLDYYIPGRYFTDKYLCPGVCDDGRNVVYSVRGNSAALSNYYNSRGYALEDPDLSGMTFSEAIPENGEAGSSAWIYFADSDYSQWVYDEETEKYIRWTYGEATNNEFKPLIDQNTNEPLAFSNVIVLHAPYTEYKTTLHSIDLIGNTEGEKATIFRNGLAYEVSWRTPEADKPIQFFDAEGNPFQLKPGNTWIVIFGLTSPTDIEEGDWSFRFSMP
ncbi:MAG: DUF3048 C-terminal domain-containing protein [Anaerolineaceae bacterium]|nr:DUF3048 C-terminal domain-containing protein [Anaerolineaceae bacterium]